MTRALNFFRRPSLPLVLLLLAVLVMVGVRIRLLTMPLERDEGEFAYAGQLMLQGIPPYKLFYNMKLPGIYAAYAAIMAVFGQSDAGIHFGALLVNLTAVWLLYRLGRRFLDEAGAAVAAASYALLSASPVVLGLAAHATQFVVVAALGGWLLLRRGEETGRGMFYFCSGLMMGVAILMKQPGAMFGLFGLCWLVLRGQRGMLWRKIGLYAGGMMLPLLLTGLILWWAGVFDRFWFWTVTYTWVHSTRFGWAGTWVQFTHYFGSFPFTADGLLWIAAAMGLACLFLTKDSADKKYWLTGFLAFSAATVSLTSYFSPHYFIMLLPALCLLAGQAADFVMQRRGLVPSAGLFGLLWLLVAFHHRAIFFELSPEAVSKKLYPINPFVECRQIGRSLGEQAASGATLAILGSEPEIPFYARRHAATSYIYMYDLVVPQPYAGEMRREMVAQTEEARPEFAVLVMTPFSWDVRPDFLRFDQSGLPAWISQFTQTDYAPVGLALMKPVPEYYWGDGAQGRVPTNAPYILIFKWK